MVAEFNQSLSKKNETRCFRVSTLPQRESSAFQHGGSVLTWVLWARSGDSDVVFVAGQLTINVQ